MAKKPSAAGAGKRTAARPKRKATPRKPVVRATVDRRKKSGRRASDTTAADALFKLLESPLVADLLAVGATAALAAIAESRSSRRTGADASSKRALKSAAKAAAAAIGRRLSTEFEEIKKASKARKGGAKA